MSLPAYLVLILVLGVAAGGVLVAAAHGCGWLVSRVAERRRMPPARTCSCRGPDCGCWGEWSRRAN